MSTITLFPRMHIGLYVADIEATNKFYSTFFGQQPVYTTQDYSKYILKMPSLVITFVKDKSKVKENLWHLGFQVETEEEMLKKLQIMKSNNYKVIEEIRSGCCFSKFWVNDPDGVHWETYYYYEDWGCTEMKSYQEMKDKICNPPNKLPQKKL
jgi:catechol 2,3-dioxygenase-like lactoylglutathione lyase family enzyme